MKIAVPVTDKNQINGHFGHSDSYGVYTITDKNEIRDVKSINAPEGCGCKSDIADKLASDGVTHMLAGGIGDGAMNVLNGRGINVIRGCSGDATEVVKLFLSGLVEDSGESCLHHEGHHNHEHKGHHHEGHEGHHHHHHHEEGHVCNHEDGHVCNHN
jgi:predicted Fe-Mo cluster-binding NifX family protein